MSAPARKSRRHEGADAMSSGHSAKKQAHVFQWMKAVLDAAVESRAHSLALVLVTFADSDGRNCYPSVNAIAQRMNASRSTAFRAIEDLECAGLLKRWDRESAQRHGLLTSSKQGGASSVYEMTVPATPDPSGGVTRDTPGSVTRDTPPVSPVTPVPTHVPAHNDLPRNQERGFDSAPLVRALIEPICSHIAAVDSGDQGKRVWRAANVEKAAREAVEAGRGVEDVELALNERLAFGAEDWVGFAVSVLQRVRDGRTLGPAPEPPPDDLEEIDDIVDWVESQLSGFRANEAGSALNMADDGQPPRKIVNTLSRRRTPVAAGSGDGTRDGGDHGPIDPAVRGAGPEEWLLAGRVHGI